MKRILIGLVLVGVVLVFAEPLQSHCEIPCGIYDDEARIGFSFHCADEA